jgi:opacity protein-like surface antigen
MFIVFVYFNCKAQTNFYTKFEIGYIKANKYYDYTSGRLDSIHGAHSLNERILGVEIIYKVSNSLRAGLALESSHHNFAKSQDAYKGIYLQDNISAKTINIMCNGYYHYGTISSLEPYFIVGVGLARNKSSDFLQKAPAAQLTIRFPGAIKTNLAWQAGAGALIPFYENLFFDISARYFDYGKTATKNMRYINDALSNPVGKVGTRLRGGMLTFGITLNF